ncbi:MAG: hypothetical protein ACLFTH_01645 [Candidatus Woesearchaeota archaeon]
MIGLQTDTEERKATIQHVIGRVCELGRPSIEANRILKYHVGLSYCSLKVLYSHERNSRPIMEIAEYFNNDSFNIHHLQGKTFDGMRTIYRASEHGLEEVALQGIHQPDADGRVCPAAEITRRSTQFSDQRGLSGKDVARFDSFLKYARRELQ